MSTKCSLFLIDKTMEHWYYDAVNKNVYIEIDRDSIEDIENEKDYIGITIKADSELAKVLKKTKFE